MVGAPVPPLVVVMGVSGCGKSAVGAVLAALLQVRFGEGDDFHRREHREKMATGTPLTDADRQPWLLRIGRWLAEHRDAGAVVSCSALRRDHRDLLRGHAPGAAFVHPHGPRALLAARIADRPDHFMPTSLLDSQLATLESLQPDERGIVQDARRPVDVLADEALLWLDSLSASA